MASTPSFVNTGSKACALCQQYLYSDESEECKRCPVKEKTKQGRCLNTPYYAVRDALDSWKWSIRDCKDLEEITKAREAFQQAAIEEVKFLTSLLP